MGTFLWLWLFEGRFISFNTSIILFPINHFSQLTVWLIALRLFLALNLQSLLQSLQIKYHSLLSCKRRCGGGLRALLWQGCWLRWCPLSSCQLQLSTCFLIALSILFYGFTSTFSYAALINIRLEASEHSYHLRFIRLNIPTNSVPRFALDLHQCNTLRGCWSILEDRRHKAIPMLITQCSGDWILANDYQG